MLRGLFHIPPFPHRILAQEFFTKALLCCCLCYLQKGKRRPGGLETWTPFPFHTDLRFEENLFVSGPPPQGEPWKHKVLSGTKKRPVCRRTHNKSPATWRGRTEIRDSGSGRTPPSAMYLTYPRLRRHHSDRLAGLLTLFHVPHQRPQTARYSIVFSIPQHQPVCKAPPGGLTPSLKISSRHVL